MFFYILLYFFEQPGHPFPNPFAEYDHGLGVLMFCEIAMLMAAIWTTKSIISRTKLKSVKYFTIPVLFVLYYITTWCCFWIEWPYAAFLAAAACVLIISIVAYIIADKLDSKYNKYRFD